MNPDRKGGHLLSLLEIKRCRGYRYTNNWSHKEHQRFREAYKKYGKDWQKIQKFIGTKDFLSTKSYGLMMTKN